MENQVLTIEQMIRLKELGVEVEIKDLYIKEFDTFSNQRFELEIEKYVRQKWQMKSTEINKI